MSERKINASNARTQCIEIAVEMLSKRDSITMTDVREFMDDLVSTKIVGGKDEDGNDKFIPISKMYAEIHCQNIALFSHHVCH